MFDLSFAELIIIAVVALLVIGPEKLPKIARTAGAFAGRLQRYVADVKDEINRESRFEELKALQQEIAEGAQSVRGSIRDEAESILASAKTDKSSYKTPSDKTRKQAKPKKTSLKAASKKAAVDKATAKKERAKKTVRKKAVK